MRGIERINGGTDDDLLHMNAMNDDSEEQEPVPPPTNGKWGLVWLISSVMPGVAIAMAGSMMDRTGVVAPFFVLGLCIISLIYMIAGSVRLGSKNGLGCLFVLGGVVLMLGCFFVGCASQLKF